MERGILDRLRTACDKSGFWERLKSSWACFDCELMPWSAKAQGLLRSQYAAVGSAGGAALPKAVAALQQAAERLPVDEKERISMVAARFERLEGSITQFVAAYRQYCWPVESPDDFKLAPFHVLATEGKVHADRDHRWHMETLSEICKTDSALMLGTEFKEIDVTDSASEFDGIDWWLKLTDRGGEGMVVKPLDFVVRGAKGLLQPAVKCRGREYLRIIYGPNYDTSEHLSQLRQRGLGVKRSLAVREFALGMEGLERFVRHEPLRRVHECVFGVLALESEPVDPRL
jgi:protein phosphatase